ncbi:MAG: hypothetical protein AAF529_10390 [Pseudomonadota bacterium]
MNKKKSGTGYLNQELRKYEDWALEDLRDLVRVLESYVQSKTTEQIEQLKEETKQKFAALGVDPSTVFETVFHTPARVRHRAPELGEHNSQILGSIGSDVEQ